MNKKEVDSIVQCLLDADRGERWTKTQKIRSSAFTIGITICFESRKIQQGRKADRMKNVDKVSRLHL